MITPSWSSYARVGLIPIQGFARLYSQTNLRFELGIYSGPGISFYSSQEIYEAIHWDIISKFIINQDVGLTVNFGQEIEAPFRANKRAYRLEGGVGAIWRI